MFERDFRLILGCCLAVVAALLLVGAVSHGILRHTVQTSPLWIAIVLAAAKSPLSKWAAFPCWVFWLLLMSAIWLYLLGWARLITGTFSPVEIVMTVFVGLASLLGIVRGFSMRSGVQGFRATAMAAAVLILQVIALRVSLSPAIAHR